MRATIIIFLLAVAAVFAWKLRDVWTPLLSSSDVVSNRDMAPTSADDQSGSSDMTASAGTSETSVQPSESDSPEETAVQREALAFIEKLTAPNPEPIAIGEVDHFMNADQAIAMLPPDTIGPADIEKSLQDGSLKPNSPITVVRQIEQVEVVSPERLIAESGGNLDKPVTVVKDGDEIQTTVREVLEENATDPDQPISIVKKVRYYEITTPAELFIDTTVQGEELIGIIKRPYQLEAASISEILRAEKLSDPDAVFYVRTVHPDDSQGIWGIVQGGVVSNFARGIAIRRGEEINTYQVDIPPLADEVLPNRSSSFLGRLIYEKTEQSYVYNYKENRMGRNPDDLAPGQEIVIIRFNPEELIGIYKHFVTDGG